MDLFSHGFGGRRRHICDFSGKENEGERWAVEIVLDRCLGKLVEPPDAANVPKSMTQININLPDPPGGRHAVPGLLDAEP